MQKLCDPTSLPCKDGDLVNHGTSPIPLFIGTERRGWLCDLSRANQRPPEICYVDNGIERICLSLGLRII